MKTIKHHIFIVLALLGTLGCDEDFVEVNTNPYAVTEVDPALLFAGAQRTHLGTWAAEHTIVQQFVNPYNQGATLRQAADKVSPLIKSNAFTLRSALLKLYETEMFLSLTKSDLNVNGSPICKFL